MRRRHACLPLMVAMALWASPAWSGAFSFSTGLPDGRLGAGARIPSGNLIEIECGDDFITTADQTTIVAATFFGLLPGNPPLPNVLQVTIEIYRVFPLDSK